MKKNIWIVVLTVLGVFIFIGGGLLFMLLLFMSDLPVVKSNSVLAIPLTGLVTEYVPYSPIGREIEGVDVQLHDIRKALHMAEVDDRIRGVYLRVSSPALGWAKAREFRDLLARFKQNSGKFVTAYLNYVDELSYYVVAEADTIFLQPYAFSALNGMAAEYPFLKRMFAKVGVAPQVVRIGEYKSAGDMWKRDSMSPAQKEATEAILEDVLMDFSETVYADRSIEPSLLQQTLATGVFESNEIAGMGLADGLKQEPEVLEHLEAQVYGSVQKNGKTRLNLIDVREYARVPLEDVGLGGGRKVGLVYAMGTIMPGESGYDPINGRVLGAGTIRYMLQQAGENNDLAAIVLRIDSPGGSALASDQIWSTVEEVRQKKPVVVSMSDVAASGGYWIAMNCDAIVAQPLTLTGSIGVVTMLLEGSEAYDKLGIDWGTVKTHPHADFPTTVRPLTEEEWRIFSKNTENFYRYFVQKVADGRGKTWQAVDEIARGRVWTGKRAAELGLVDSLGGLDVALAIAKEKAGLRKETRTQWVVYPEPKSLVESFLDLLQIRAAQISRAAHPEAAYLQTLAPQLKSLVQQLAFIGKMQRGDILAYSFLVPQIW